MSPVEKEKHSQIIMECVNVMYIETNPNTRKQDPRKTAREKEKKSEGVYLKSRTTRFPNTNSVMMP